MIEFSGAKVRGLMAENKMTLVDVALELNVSISTLQEKINEKREFKYSEIKQLAKLFDVVFTISC